VKRRLLLGAAVLLLLVAAGAGGRLLLKRLSFFSVRRIELAGARYLTPAEVTRALRLPAHASIFDDIGPLERRANAIPGVLEARITRRLPGALRVTVHEAEPVALAERGGRLVLLDAAGHTLPFDPTSPAADLPLAEADSAVAGFLTRLRESDPELFARVERGARLRQDIALEVREGRILFRAGASSDEIRELSIVASLLARQGRPWRELDARFLPRVVVRRSGA
jgi:cell division septal protein FtsQ